MEAFRLSRPVQPSAQRVVSFRTVFEFGQLNANQLMRHAKRRVTLLLLGALLASTAEHFLWSRLAIIASFSRSWETRYRGTTRHRLVYI
jgi:hypothetical protein